MVGKYHQFKDGDFIVPMGRENLVIIYHESIRFDFFYCLRANGSLITPDFPLDHIHVDDLEFRSASPLEVKAMLEALLKCGCVWDFLRKRAVHIDDLNTLFYHNT